MRKKKMKYWIQEDTQIARSPETGTRASWRDHGYESTECGKEAWEVWRHEALHQIPGCSERVAIVSAWHAHATEQRYNICNTQKTVFEHISKHRGKKLKIRHVAEYFCRTKSNWRHTRLQKCVNQKNLTSLDHEIFHGIPCKVIYLHPD